MLCDCNCGWKQGDFDGIGKTLAAKLFPLELDIVTDLYAMGREAYAKGIRTGKWTAEVKGCLHDLGKKEGYLVYPERAKSRSGFKGE